MKVLYIIGNGFDLWHNLPTRYADFYTYAKEQLTELEEYFSVDCANDIPWHNFEHHLGEFNSNYFYDAHNNIDITDESFRRSMMHCLEDYLQEQADEMIDNIRSSFQSWIDSISIEAVKEKFKFTSESIFISFNYTSVLQDVYNIPDECVFHIHGCANQHNELIFGHGEELNEEPEPEVDEYGDSTRTIFTDSPGIAKYPLYALKKPVKKNLEQRIEYFKKLNNIDLVVVLGHSLNDIDLPYFKKIRESTANCTWIVSMQKEKESVHYYSQLKRCGLGKKNIILSFMDKIPKEICSAIKNRPA